MAVNTAWNTAAINQGIIDFTYSPEQGVTWLTGSFGGNSTSSPTAGSIVGGWIASVSLVSTGHYRVQMALPLPNDLAVYTVPQLVQEPLAYVYSASITTVPALATTGNGFSVTCSSFDTTTNLNTFDIFVYTQVFVSGTPSLTATLTNVATTDRIQFQLAFKNTSVLP